MTFTLTDIYITLRNIFSQSILSSPSLLKRSDSRLRASRQNNNNWHFIMPLRLLKCYICEWKAFRMLIRLHVCRCKFKKLCKSMFAATWQLRKNKRNGSAHLPYLMHRFPNAHNHILCAFLKGQPGRNMIWSRTHTHSVLHGQSNTH